VTRLDLRPYRPGDDLPPRSVPVTVVVLTRDEEANIARCLGSVGWAEQVVVVDSGSADRTVPIARSLGASVVAQPWLGFSAQREFALRLPEARHDWIYFVDADEFVSPQLAAEISTRLRGSECAAFSQRFRMVFKGTWMRHCGWYGGSWIVRLVDRRYTKYGSSLVGERAAVDGPVGRLANDLVDDDRKGLARWLRKHVGYAELEVERSNGRLPLRERLRRVRDRDRTSTKPLTRIILKDLIFPYLPARPLAVFLYMYVARLGFLDGRAGLSFCFFHAWHQAVVSELAAEARRTAGARPAGDRSLETQQAGVMHASQASGDAGHR
jgi:glycosyltransferase involved in cell wall biosynthesis